MLRALVNGRVLDGTANPPVDGFAVVVDGATIAAVVPPAALPEGIDRFDLGGAVVMPGLIDCHAHFALWAFEPLPEGRDVAGLVADTASALRGALETGCTTARDPGGLSLTVRESLAGPGRAPRVLTSVTIISPVDGITVGMREGAPVSRLVGMPDPDCTGADAARAKVREVVAAGADFVKVAATGGVASPRREPRQRLLSDLELEAIVDEAHRLGRRVACHALGGPALLAAIRAGVDSLEHGVWLDDEAIAEMARRGTWYVPTLAAYELHLRLGGPLQRERAVDIVPAHRESVRRAHAAGVRIACGSDGGVYGHDVALELELLVGAGLSPSEAVAAATSRAAACLGWEDRIGLIRPGYAADLLVVDGDPTKDIGVLRDPARIRVIQAGAFVGGI